MVVVDIMHATDIWRTLIGSCMHIMASQVQAGNIMILFIDISQKIRELTEVIHTFVCVAS